MAKAYSSDEIATRTFLITMAVVGAFIASVVVFIL